MIDLQDIRITVGAFSLEGVSLSVGHGEYGVLMGKTGSGKTTLLEAVAGLKPIRGGRIILGGRDVSRLKPAERNLGYVPQDGALFSTLSVRDHFAFALKIRRVCQSTIDRRVAELAELLAVEHLLDRKPVGLSGGEQQRVALGRALSFEPPVLLLDEPLSALDDETRRQMYQVVRRVREATGVTALHVTHSMDEALALADALFQLQSGRIDRREAGAVSTPADPGGHDLTDPLPIEPRPLTPEDRAIWQWQMWTHGFGESGQQRLKGASVLVSRVGGLGSVVALELAAAGVGRLVLAHAGNVKPSDLNRQVLMTHDWIGKPRVESAQRRLRELNPRLQIVAVDQNITEDNAADLVAQADVVVDCAPLFEERQRINREAVRQDKPMVECAMYELEAHITTVLPRRSPCLRCLYPEDSTTWKRQFPVFGAVSGTVGCMGAMEAIKLIAGLGEPLAGRLLRFDLGSFHFEMVKTYRDPNCPCCGSPS